MCAVATSHEHALAIEVIMGLEDFPNACRPPSHIKNSRFNPLSGMSQAACDLKPLENLLLRGTGNSDALSFGCTTHEGPPCCYYYCCYCYCKAQSTGGTRQSARFMWVAWKERTKSGQNSIPAS